MVLEARTLRMNCLTEVCQCYGSQLAEKGVVTGCHGDGLALGGVLKFLGQDVMKRSYRYAV